MTNLLIVVKHFNVKLYVLVLDNKRVVTSWCYLCMSCLFIAATTSSYNATLDYIFF